MIPQQFTPTITVIPATLDLFTYRPLGCTRKLRTAGYARVSTKSEEQLNSYENQVSYYTDHIKSNPDWVFVRVYTDKGLSGTSLKKRDGFNQMIADALAGKIDLIITKSASRFMRNTLEGLNVIRKLREKGVDVYFEELDIHSIDPSSEAILTNHLNQAQEESRITSENVKWGKRNKMSKGKINLPYKHFLGYRKGADGLPEIVEEEAVIVRSIYKMFLDGRTYREIALHLSLQGIKTPTGKDVWSMATVKSILQNEKYAGNAILQKSYTVDFLNKKKKANNGELNQFYLTGSHPAIISPETFELVQAEIQRRKELGKQISVSGKFVSRIVCGQCGGLYGSKVWHSNTKYRRTVWRCNRKYDGDETCRTPHLDEEQIHNVFITAWNSLIEEKVKYVAECENKIAALSKMSDLDKQEKLFREECANLEVQMMDCINQNARFAQNQAEYRKQYDELVTLHTAAKDRLEEIITEKRAVIIHREKLRHFLKVLQSEATLLTEFDERLWREVVEAITVYTLENIAVRFSGGIEIRVNIGG